MVFKLSVYYFGYLKNYYWGKLFFDYNDVIIHRFLQYGSVIVYEYMSLWVYE